MPPSRKKSVNKQFPIEVSPQKKARNWGENVEQVTAVKRKSAYKLGPPWHETEIQKFYKAYRKHGKDWERVTAEVSTRSLEMVEALYKLHRAYLSLPEGTASVHGLIAMVSDHYSVLQASSDSEREDNSVPQVPHKSLKRKRVKVPLSEQTELPVSTTADGCMSLLKRVRLLGGQPRAVGKRTPRFPVSYNKDNAINYAFQRNRKLNAVSREEEVAHVAALVLTETSRRGGSQVSQTSRGRIEQDTLSLVKSKDKKAESAVEKLYDVSIHDGRIQGAGSKVIRNVEYDGGVGLVERKEKKIRGKKMKVGVTDRLKGDGAQASGGTEEGKKMSGLSRKVDTKVSNGKLKVTSPQGEKRKSKKYFSGDEFSALDALQTLANLSVMESESSAQLNEETSTVDLETTFADHNRDITEGSSMNDKVRDTVIGVEATTSRKSKSRRVAETDGRHASEAQQPNDSMNDNSLKRRRPSVVSRSQAPSVEANTNPPLSDLVKTNDLPGKEILPVKGKQTSEVSDPSRQLKRSGSDYNSDPTSEPSGPSVAAEHCVNTQASLPMPSRKTRRKRFPYNIVGEKSKAIACSLPLQGGASHSKEDISSCLSSPLIRRWCTFEWFYSAIDYPWFTKREFVEYLNHVGLCHIPTLTRVEWGVIRSSLGKPRRFSEHFLREERSKLQQYRESVRKHYSELRAGVRNGLPTDLAKPLWVGQDVIAVHPRTREVHNGRVLTVDHEECRVQFYNSKIGVEVIQDVDCMPFHSMDNMPEALKRQKYFDAMKEVEINGYSDNRKLNSVGPVESVPTPMNTRIKQAQATENTTSQLKALGIQASDAQNVPLGQFSATSALDPTHSLNRKQGNQMHLPWLTSSANSNSYHNSFASQDTGSAAAAEIINSSRQRAHKMLDAALQAFSSKREGEDVFATIREALNKMDISRRGGTLSIQTSSESIVNLSSSLVSSPSELMTSCVATLLMIKMCTERQYPPADVAQIIDSAVTNLQPCCSQNLPIYREIQTCMGRIKTQILALVPT
ncbi:unnamed protein product [Linum tenue]|uniref:SANT domain-containing protein n=1 Tax=Linum tenue TaxID=586396 RepID=A0AAV0R191_9ROSI|nr:unnamed protein product [Linum tenue]